MPDNSAEASTGFPPLPTAIPKTHLQDLALGCHTITLDPAEASGLVRCEGTLRVSQSDSEKFLSGDLYDRGLQHEPSEAIPIYPRSTYRYYVRATGVDETALQPGRLGINLDLYRQNPHAPTWQHVGDFVTDIALTAGEKTLYGDLLRDGHVVGSLRLRRVSDYLRRAVVEVDRESQSECPTDNGLGQNWASVFAAIGWQIDLQESDTDIPMPEDGTWADAELHHRMLKARDRCDMDREWPFHLLCVGKLSSGGFGLMYDERASDSNRLPREGAAISSEKRFEGRRKWGAVGGERIGANPGLYFRTAVHEIGHALGLDHPEPIVDRRYNGFMTTTGEIARNAASYGHEFPANVVWSFRPKDAMRLSHRPDPCVRPGGSYCGCSPDTAPFDAVKDLRAAAALRLGVFPVKNPTPLGAPVRVDLVLTNTGSQPAEVPEKLSLKSGSVRGRVIDPEGVPRSFRPLFRYSDDSETRKLLPGKGTSHSLTLLRGAEGALFPLPGNYQIEVEIEWEVDGNRKAVTGTGPVSVSPAVNDRHAEVAEQLLSTPDLLLSLTIGGDHHPDGAEALRAGLDDPVLGPHFAAIEVKGLAKRIPGSRAAIDAALDLIDETTVMSVSEARRIVEVVQGLPKSAGRQSRAKRLVEVLRTGMERFRDRAAVEALLKDLETAAQ